ncbi:HAD family hydrolase [Shewanella livingstonensis]|uniref:HAD family hydrolase n=1 Tax=Shewanella livingstonensis TaxID=150120 RepID=A0A3G8LWU3_9GAMM|nr:HAD-IA family hydrolase [Shewanella livingstonensis]AZG73160.1 HAD family hydrolase [Shewanella livingstonensis]
MHKHDIKGVLFDLDGTLADTAPDLVQALNLSLDEAGFNVQPLEMMRHAASHGSLYLVKTAIPDADEYVQVEIQQALLRHYARINGDHSRLFDDLPELLSLLDSQAIPYGVVTNKPARFSRPLVEKLGLTYKLKAMISGDSTRHSKPHTAPMLLAAQQIAIAPQSILYLGDAERDLVAARNASMIGGVALWGYLSTTDQPDTWPASKQFEHGASLKQFFTE